MNAREADVLESAWQESAAREMRIWVKPNCGTIGYVFCPVCGWNGDVVCDLAAYARDPFGCGREGCKNRKEVGRDRRK